MLFVASLLLLLPQVLWAQQKTVPGFSEPLKVQDKEDRQFDISGYFRTRFDVLENLDLNHGPTPSTGQPIFPTRTSGDNGPLTSANMRLRLEPTVQVGWGLMLQARIDILDNVVLGSTPEGLPTSTQAPMSGGSVLMAPPQAGTNSDVDSIRVKRVWADLALPFGVLSVGRMGALVDWGTGFFLNSGNCIDCDLGDIGDRVGLTLPLLGHMMGFAFDFGASGPTSATLRTDYPQPFDLDRRDDVRSYALFVTRYNLPEVVERYRRAGKTLLQYGVVASLRTQEYDIPTYYLTGDLNRQYESNDLVRRGLLAFAADVWFGIRHRGWTLDIEGALVLARVDNASMLPGVETRDEITARQYGGVARLLHRWPMLELKLELGLASGDAAPGFGFRSPLNQFSSRPGDLDGPQIAIPGDTEINNFRFSPDYHVDLILWRQIVGTVTDAIYGRPSARYQVARDMWIGGAVIASAAMEPDSTPSGQRPLGVELDLTASYTMQLGFDVLLTYGILFPLSGFENVRLDLSPEPAQALHVILAYRIP
jgi:uncharacterized protein (TIGR04551 family)